MVSICIAWWGDIIILDPGSSESSVEYFARHLPGDAPTANIFHRDEPRIFYFLIRSFTSVDFVGFPCCVATFQVMSLLGIKLDSAFFQYCKELARASVGFASGPARISGPVSLLVHPPLNITWRDLKLEAVSPA
jgi:hypothetical protein